MPLNEFLKALVEATCDPAARAAFKNKLLAITAKNKKTRPLCCAAKAPVHDLFDKPDKEWKWKIEQCAVVSPITNHSKDAWLKDVLMNQSIEDFTATALHCSHGCEHKCCTVRMHPWDEFWRIDVVSGLLVY